MKIGSVFFAFILLVPVAFAVLPFFQQPPSPQIYILKDKDWNGEAMYLTYLKVGRIDANFLVNRYDVNVLRDANIEGDLNVFGSLAVANWVFLNGLHVIGDANFVGLQATNAFIDKNVYASDANIGGIKIPLLYTRATEPTGFVDRTSSSLGFVDATRAFTITGTGFPVYTNGVEYLKNTESIIVADTTGTHWIYYAADGTLSQTTAVQTFEFPTIATIYYNTDGGFDKGTLGEERHGIKMDVDTHALLHYTVGTRYESGLTGTFGNTTFDTTSGVIDDEDLAHQIGVETTCKVFYKDGAADFIWTTEQAEYYYEVGGTLQYNNGNALANVTAANHVAYWIFATNDTTTPIYSLMGQRQDVTLANARINNTYESLTLGTLPFQEMKILYRVILKNVGGTTTYVETQDLRSVSNLPAGTYVATHHNVLTGLNWSQAGHTFDTDLNLGAYGLKAFGDSNFANMGMSGKFFGLDVVDDANFAANVGISGNFFGNTSLIAGIDKLQCDNCTASGTSSVALGSGTVASGSSSFASGYETIASGSYSVAMGVDSVASSDRTVAMGATTTASDSGAVAMGGICRATNDYAVAMGFRTISDGDGAVAMGYGLGNSPEFNRIWATGRGSIAMGFGGALTDDINLVSSGEGSVALGYGTRALNDGAVALGYNARALGEATVSLGKDITCEKDNQTCVHDLNASGDTNLTSLEANNAYFGNLTCTVDANFASLEADNIYGGAITGTNTNWDNAFSHTTSDGTSHTFINQSVVTTAAPTFDRLTLTASATANPQILVGSPHSTIANTGAYDTLVAQHPQAGIRLASSQASSSGQGAGLILYSIDGVALQTGDRLGFNLFGGLTSPTTLAHGAGVSAYADGTWTTSGDDSAPTRITFEVAPVGSTSRSVGLEIKSDRNVLFSGVPDDDIGTEPALLIQADGQIGIDTSSIRYKENVEDLDQTDLDKILQLRPVTYNKIGSENKEYGLIAEEVNELFPELVSYKYDQIWKCSDDGVGGEVCEVDKVKLALDEFGEPIPETVIYRKMAILAIELAQRQEQEIQTLKGCIADSKDFTELKVCVAG